MPSIERRTWNSTTMIWFCHNSTIQKAKLYIICRGNIFFLCLQQACDADVIWNRPRLRRWLSLLMNNTTQPDLQTLLTRSSQQVGERAAVDAAAASDAAAAASPTTTSSRPLLSPPKQLWWPHISIIVVCALFLPLFISFLFLCFFGLPRNDSFNYSVRLSYCCRSSSNRIVPIANTTSAPVTQPGAAELGVHRLHVYPQILPGKEAKLASSRDVVLICEPPDFQTFRRPCQLISSNHDEDKDDLLDVKRASVNGENHRLRPLQSQVDVTVSLPEVITGHWFHKYLLTNSQHMFQLQNK